MKLALKTQIYSFKKDDDIYDSDAIVKFNPNIFNEVDMQICIPLLECKIDDDDELIITIPNRSELIVQLLKAESAETQLSIIAAAQNKL